MAEATLLQTFKRGYNETQTFTAPYSGWYRIRVFGASGMGSIGSTGEYTDDDGDTVYTAKGGRGGQGGGYACSEVRLAAGDTLSIFCGEGGGKPLYGYEHEGETTTVTINSSVETYSKISVTCGSNGSSRWSSCGIATGGNIENIQGDPGGSGEDWETKNEDSVYASGGYGGYPPVYSNGKYEGCRGGEGGGVSDGYEDQYPGDGEDGYVEVYSLNTAPSDPLSITYGQPVAGYQLTLTTGGSTDDEGDAITYVFERSIDGGTYTEVGQTSELSLNDTIPTEGTTYTARVKAVDAAGGESAYVTGETLTISYNSPPEITGEDADLGDVSEPPVYTYTVTDPNEGDTVTVVEKVITASGEEHILREYTAELGVETSVQWNCHCWVCCENGVNKLVITATDSAGTSATRTLTMTRAVNCIKAARAVATDAMPTKILLSLYPAPVMLPGDCAIEAYVTNNPFDDSPVWEDVSGKLNTMVHTFANSTCANGYGIGYKFCIDKGEEKITFDQAVLRFA